MVTKVTLQALTFFIDNISIIIMKYQKMAASQKEDLRKAVILMRYRTENPTQNSRKYASYSTIAQVVRLTVYEVQHMCRKALLPAKRKTFEQVTR